MTQRKGTLNTLMAATLMILIGAISLAQEFRGSITGKITEASGAAVPNAEYVDKHQNKRRYQRRW